MKFINYFKYANHEINEIERIKIFKLLVGFINQTSEKDLGRGFLNMWITNALSDLKTKYLNNIVDQKCKDKEEHFTAEQIEWSRQHDFKESEIFVFNDFYTSFDHIKVSKNDIAGFDSGLKLSIYRNLLGYCLINNSVFMKDAALLVEYEELASIGLESRKAIINEILVTQDYFSSNKNESRDDQLVKGNIFLIVAKMFLEGDSKIDSDEVNHLKSTTDGLNLNKDLFNMINFFFSNSETFERKSPIYKFSEDEENLTLAYYMKLIKSDGSIDKLESKVFKNICTNLHRDQTISTEVLSLSRDPALTAQILRLSPMKKFTVYINSLRLALADGIIYKDTEWEYLKVILEDLEGSELSSNDGEYMLLLFLDMLIDSPELEKNKNIYNMTYKLIAEYISIEHTLDCLVSLILFGKVQGRNMDLSHKIDSLCEIFGDDFVITKSLESFVHNSLSHESIRKSTENLKVLGGKIDYVTAQSALSVSLTNSSYLMHFNDVRGRVAQFIIAEFFARSSESSEDYGSFRSYLKTFLDSSQYCEFYLFDKFMAIVSLINAGVSDTLLSQTEISLIDNTIADFDFNNYQIDQLRFIAALFGAEKYIGDVIRYVPFKGRNISYIGKDDLEKASNWYRSYCKEYGVGLDEI